MKKKGEEVQFEVELPQETEIAIDIPQAELEDKDAIVEDEDVVPTDDADASPNDERPQSVWRRLFQSEDLPQMSLREILGGDFLVGHFLRRQIGFILLLVVLGIGYITNRYAAQQEIIQEENLRKELTEKKNYALTQYCELTQQSRQSMLEQRLQANGDSTLTIPKEPPFFIKRKQE